MGSVLSLLTPLLLHMFAFQCTAVVFGGHLDSTGCTTIAAMAVIPFGIWMRYKDNGNHFGLRSDYGHGASKIGKGTWEKGPREKGTWEKGTCGKGTCGKGTCEKGVCERAGQVVLAGILCFVGGGILNLLWSGIMNLMQIQNYFSNETQESLLASQMAWQILGLGVLVPFAEELVFRWLTYTRMKKFFPVKIAVFLSCVLFAVYHGTLIQIIYAFPMALVITALYEWKKLFIYPVLFHMGANLTAVFLNFSLYNSCM